MDDEGTGQRAFYPTTIWTEVRLAAASNGDGSTLALEALLKRYYRPLQLHLEFKFRANPAQSADWLQGFIQQKMLLGDLVSRASRDRGRFRTFLLNSLDNYVRGQLRHDHAARRCPPGGTVSMEELSLENVVSMADGAKDPGTLEWGRTVVAETLSRMEQKCQRKGQQGRWGVFKARLLDPFLDASQSPRYEVLVKEFDYSSPAEAANALVTAKRMFQSTLREVVAEYAGDGEDVESAIRELKQALTGTG
ncbi:MAG: hypothetical protein ACREIC_22680 [Limisphaerales bacterium]